MFIEILFKMFLFKGGVLLYAEHCIWMHMGAYECIDRCICMDVYGQMDG